MNTVNRFTMLQNNVPHPVPVPQSLFKSCIVKGPNGEEYEALLPVPLPNGDGKPDNVSTEEAISNAKMLIPLHKNDMGRAESPVNRMVPTIPVQQQNHAKQVKVIPVKIPRSALTAALNSPTLHLNSVSSVANAIKTKQFASDASSAATLPSHSAKFIVVPNLQGGVQKIMTLSKPGNVVTSTATQSLLKTQLAYNQFGAPVEVRRLQRPSVPASLLAGGNTKVTYVSNPKMATSHTGPTLHKSSAPVISTGMNNSATRFQTYYMPTNPQTKLGTQQMVPIGPTSLLKSAITSNPVMAASAPAEVPKTNATPTSLPQMVHLPPLPPGYVYAVHNSPVTVVNTPVVTPSPTMTTPAIPNAVPSVVPIPPTVDRSKIQTIKINGQSYAITNEELSKFVHAARAAKACSANTAIPSSLAGQSQVKMLSHVAQQITGGAGSSSSNSFGSNPYVVSSTSKNANMISRPPKAVIAVTDPSVLKNLQTLTTVGKKCFLVKKSTTPLPAGIPTVMTSPPSTNDSWLKEILSKLSPPKSCQLKTYEKKPKPVEVVEQNNFNNFVSVPSSSDDETDVQCEEMDDEDDYNDPSRLLEPVVEIIEEKGKRVNIPNWASPRKPQGMIRKENVMPKSRRKRKRNSYANASTKRAKVTSQRIQRMKLDLTCLSEYQRKALTNNKMSISGFIRKNIPLPRNQRLEFIWCNYDSSIKLKECRVKLKRLDMDKLINGRLNLAKEVVAGESVSDIIETNKEHLTVNSIETKTTENQLSGSECGSLLKENEIKKEGDDFFSKEISVPVEKNETDSPNDGWNSRVKLLRERFKATFAETNELKRKL